MNRQEADQDPAEWLPPSAEALCWYGAEWTATKLRWGLAVDERERDLRRYRGGVHARPGRPAANQRHHRPVNGWEPTQTERRFDLVELDRFRYDTPEQITAWTSHLAGVETHLRLLKARPGRAIVGAITGTLTRPGLLVLGRPVPLRPDAAR
ncbi:hypothetical protein ACFW9N_41890 [Streptomyces sp. NPDC059496]|uniref:hypothetical protein n=1 Tax=Streptomyces sp. NPDC059496 TaxID=3346851 RepID=UPI00369FBFDD